jgi:putative transposase
VLLRREGWLVNKKLVYRLYREEGLGIRRRKPRRRDVARVLEQVTSHRGKPQSIRVDNGPEFISRSLGMWASFNGVKLDFSRPGKPTDNAVIESLNGRLRDECLNQHWFLSLDEARAVTEAWREDYNRVRPHGALGNRTPSEFARPVDGHAHLPALHG